MKYEDEIEYWIKTAEHDLPVAESLFSSGHYVWCLFIGHLVLEKILKAHYVKDNHESPPKIHDLVKLAEKTKLDLSVEQISFLDKVSDLQTEVLYPEYKNSFNKTATFNFTKENFNKIIEIYKWLRSLLK